MEIGYLTADTESQRTGIGNYIFHLYNALIKEQISLTTINYSLEKNNLWGEIQITPWYPPMSFDLMLWSGCVALQKSNFKNLDLLHSPTLCLFPFKPHKKFIITVHDIVHHLYPEFCTNGIVRYTKLLFQKNINFADHIIADSHATKNDLIVHYKIPNNKITVIHIDASDEFVPLPIEQKVKIRRKYHLNNPFILFVGTIEPRKNFSLLFKAYQEIVPFFPDTDLVIAGGKGWYIKESLKEKNSLNLDKKIRFLGYVPSEDLPSLYNAAELFIYPSIYEGFGIPPLEAMRCGIPVITSNVSSLPEVMGPEGLMVNPQDVKGLGNLIIKVLSDEEFRMKNINYNLNRAKNFSWEKTAKETINVYKLCTSIH